MMLGRGRPALAEANRGSPRPEQTESLKYVGWFHARRGELALRGGDAAAAVESLKRAVAIARRIAYPTLTWQAADLLARASMALGARDEATRGRPPCARTRSPRSRPRRRSRRSPTRYGQWPRVIEMQETVERVRRM